MMIVRRVLLLQQLRRRAYVHTFADIDGLSKSEDWVAKTAAALTSIEELRQELRRNTNNERGLRLLDTISNRLCSVVDAAELCRSVHPCEKMRNAAEIAFETCCNYMDSLNGDRELYAYTTNLYSIQNEEARTLAIAFASEFERDGIHLSTKIRNNVARNRQKCRELEAQILQLEDGMLNTAAQNKENFITIAENDAIAVQRAQNELNAAINCSDQTFFRVSQNLNSIYISTDPIVLLTGIKVLSDPIARKRCFFALEASLSESRQEILAKLAQLIDTRSSLSQDLGFSSFVQMIIQGPPKSALHSQEQVAQFLLKSSAQNPKKLYEPWNIEYDMFKLRNAAADRVRAQLNIDTKPQIDPLRISRYSISACVVGLAIVAKSAFGLNIIETNHHTNSKQGCWANGVRRLEVSDQYSNVLGIIYLDLEARSGKQSVGASHFTIRCGCDIASKYIDSPSTNQVIQTWGFCQNDNVLRQLPVVALVASFSQIVSHSDLETLFHEWGHALHSVLSSTSSQHLSGTRGATDLVEFPSTLLEACAWHPTILEAIDNANDCEDTLVLQEPLSVLRAAALIDRHVDSIRQLRLAVFDQLLHGNHMTSTSKVEQPLPSIESALTYANSLVPLYSRPYSSDLLSFIHLATAPATYYAYPFNRSLAIDLRKSKLFDLDAPPNMDIYNFLTAGSLGNLDDIFLALEERRRTKRDQEEKYVFEKEGVIIS